MAGYGPWGLQELDVTERLNHNKRGETCSDEPTGSVTRAGSSQRAAPGPGLCAAAVIIGSLILMTDGLTLLGLRGRELDGKTQVA